MAGHSFDRARQGYLSLLGGRGRRFPGDTVDQVLARNRVQSFGVFDPVARAVAEIAERSLGSPVGCPVTDPGRSADNDHAGGAVVLDAGAGSGFYLAQTLDRLGANSTEAPLGIGTELSVPAARRLARAHSRAAAIVADTWSGLPLVDSSVDVIQVVFAPRNAAEFSRLLRPGGTLIVGVPGAGHLEPLRSVAGMLTVASGKSDTWAGGFGTGFDSRRVAEVDVSVTVPTETARDVALMGPSGVHLDPEDLTRRLGTGDHLVRIHVEVWSLRRLRD